ncbi:hypothetical protein L226DRAFT_70140 [Lentinus tigrinus ALCF2SS1-7]|uniref:uncharacterized protein n=1 Tax=Lentinus tigrinus ALCF2SS1-7 TaxID=1328758 RepID=UPI00116629E6|nr:hypothetical protein L226DRAFT_70140 [Lentinus tigrinus ALCF2SS1-7]
MLAPTMPAAPDDSIHCLPHDHSHTVRHTRGRWLMTRRSYAPQYSCECALTVRGGLSSAMWDASADVVAGGCTTTVDPWNFVGAMEQPSVCPQMTIASTGKCMRRVGASTSGHGVTTCCALAPLPTASSGTALMLYSKIHSIPCRSVRLS